MDYIMDDDKLTKDAIDGEVIEETSPNTADTDIEAENSAVDGSDQATMLLNLEDLIKNTIESTEKLRSEIKQAREMFDDSFNNNPTFREASEKLKDVSKARNQVRQQIVKQPSVATIAQKVKDLRFDLNEQLKTLSDLLQDYHEQTGATEIETRSGQVMEIVSTAKLVKKGKYNP